MSTPILDVVVPIFGVMILGFAAARTGLVTERGVRGLVLFAFFFAIPALLFRSLATVELPDDIEWSFLLAFYFGSFTAYGAAMLAGRVLFARPTDHQAIFGMAGAFSNTVMLGIPITLTAFGPEASLPLFLIITFHSATFMPLTVGIIQGSRGGSSRGDHFRTVAGQVLRNPIIVGLFLGLIANLAGIELPGPVDRTAELLGASAVPAALFALGGSLAAYPLMGDVGPAVLLTSIKLVLHPLVVWVVAVPVLGLTGVWVSVAVTLAAMPSGVNAYLFAARYEAAAGVAARTVFLTTCLTLVTIPVLLVLLSL